MPRYRFDEFVVSPAERTLSRGGREVALIPRYFDLLVLLVRERERAVQRAEILDRVWSDVVVSDGALSQAIRTLRRALGDTAREPAFIRTVSRHGYRFVHPGVVEEDDRAAASGGPARGVVATPTAPNAPNPPPPASGAPGAPSPPLRDAPARDADPFEAPLRILLGEGKNAGDDGADARAEVAETLHLLGTAETLRRLDRRPGHERARAILRDARWSVAGAGAVPLLGAPGTWRTIVALVRLRLERAAGIAASRWGAAAAGGGAAGAIAGLLGGWVLGHGPGGEPSPGLPLALAVLGLIAGGAAAAGIGAGLAFAETIARSARGTALVLAGAAAGALTAEVLHVVLRSTLRGLFGRGLSGLAGAWEGLALGAAAGLGYALSTSRVRDGGMATPRGWSRAGAALATGACCAVACAIVCALGGNFAGTSLNLLARAYEGSHVGLAPLARILGERDPGPLTRAVSGGIEGFFFGTGLIAGLTHRPR